MNPVNVTIDLRVEATDRMKSQGHCPLTFVRSRTNRHCSNEPKEKVPPLVAAGPHVQSITNPGEYIETLGPVSVRPGPWNWLAGGCGNLAMYPCGLSGAQPV